jgi:hypothetical protein
VSVQHIALVLEASGLCAQEKAVLTAFCNHTNPSGKTYAGEERLMRESGMPRTTFQRWRNQLVKRGLLISKRKGRKGGGRATSDTWVNLEALRAARDPWFDKKPADRDEDESPFTSQDVPKVGRGKGSTDGAKGRGSNGPASGAINGPISGAINGPASGAAMAPPVEPRTLSNPQMEPSEEPAPFGRVSAPDARRASTGSSSLASQGGSAASGKTSPAADRQTAEAVCTVVAALPDELRKLESRPLPVPVPARPLGDLIREQLQHRTAQQLAERIGRRWVGHGWAEKCHSVNDGQLLRSGVGIAVELLAAPECPDPRCEDGTDVDTGAPCRACPERHADHQAARRAGLAGSQRLAPEPVPAQRPATGDDVWWHCTECRAPGRGIAPADGLCRDCRGDIQAVLVSAGLALTAHAEAPQSA